MIEAPPDEPLGMSYVELDSAIALSDPDKEAIEWGLTRAFSNLPGGPWRISIRRSTLHRADRPRADYSVCVSGRNSVSAGAMRSSGDLEGFMMRAGFRSAQ